MKDFAKMEPWAMDGVESAQKGLYDEGFRKSGAVGRSVGSGMGSGSDLLDRGRGGVQICWIGHECGAEVLDRGRGAHLAFSLTSVTLRCEAFGRRRALGRRVGARRVLRACWMRKFPLRIL